MNDDADCRLSFQKTAAYEVAKDTALAVKAAEIAMRSFVLKLGALRRARFCRRRRGCRVEADGCGGGTSLAPARARARRRRRSISHA